MFFGLSRLTVLCPSSQNTLSSTLVRTTLVPFFRSFGFLPMVETSLFFISDSTVCSPTGDTAFLLAYGILALLSSASRTARRISSMLNASKSYVKGSRGWTLPEKLVAANTCETSFRFPASEMSAMRMWNAQSDVPKELEPPSGKMPPAPSMRENLPLLWSAGRISSTYMQTRGFNSQV